MNIHDQYKIPSSDAEAWEQYTQFNWIYDTQRLLDAQHIKWTPFYGDRFDQSIPIHHYDSEVVLIEKLTCLLPGEQRSGHIFIELPEIEKHRFTEAVIVTGDIKVIIQSEDNISPTNNLIGEAELRVYAFIAMYMNKFTGCASFETYGNEIYVVKLRPTPSMLPSYESDMPRLLKRHLKRVAA